MKKCLTLSILLFLPAMKLLAQDHGGTVGVIDEHRYSLTGRFTLDLQLAMLPLDAFFKPLTVDAGLSYQLSDHFSWEFARFGYSFANQDSGLIGFIENNLEDHEFEGDPITRHTRYYASSQLYFNLLRGKSNLFNRAIIYHTLQVGGGPIYFNYKDDYQVGANASLKARFFISKMFSLISRAEHSYGFREDNSTNRYIPKNNTILGVGLGISF